MNDREKIAELEETIRQLRRIISPPNMWRFDIQVGPVKQRLLSTLYARAGQWTTHAWLFESATVGAEGAENLVRQHIFQLRKLTLHPLGIRIKSAIWRGYMLDEMNAAKLSKFMVAA